MIYSMVHGLAILNPSVAGQFLLDTTQSLQVSKRK